MGVDKIQDGPPRNDQTYQPQQNWRLPCDVSPSTGHEMTPRIKLVQTLMEKWPGKRYFGIYRFMPLFFIMGAALEFSMINWRPFGVNFYDVYKRKEARKLAEQSLKDES